VRAVADTNVYISALNFGGTADEILTLGRAQAVQLFISPPILEEIEGVLVRKFRWSATRTRQAIAAVQEFAQVVRPKVTIHVVAEDEPDNRILECALEADADIVITGDKHLQQLKMFRGIPIVSPGEFLQTYGSR
jgi:putative PIN family toxin of toxin-antitoxin system